MKITIGRCLQPLLLLCALLAFNSSLVAQENAELIPFWDDREPESNMSADHGLWQSLLDRYLDDSHSSGINRFDYSAVSQADRTQLSTYLNQLQSIEPRQFRSTEQKAYWINLYNAATVSLTIKNLGSMKSIRELRSGAFIAGPWKRKVVTVSGQKLSLDDIEHGILRPIFKDPRIHYALSHSSLGCPNLQKKAFTGQTIEDQLDLAAKQFIGHARAVRIDSGKLFLSSIFSWYLSDFGSNFADLMTHLSSYVDAESAEQLQRFGSAEYSFNWLLNTP